MVNVFHLVCFNLVLQENNLMHQFYYSFLFFILLFLYYYETRFSFHREHVIMFV